MFIYTYILTDEQQQYYQTISLINFSSWEIVGSADNKFPSSVHVTGAVSPKYKNVTANIPIKKDISYQLIILDNWSLKPSYHRVTFSVLQIVYNFLFNLH